MKIKDIVLIGILSAILFVVQITFSFIPNVELVSLLILLFSQIYKKKTLYIIYTFVMLEGFLYGFGLWWINYLYVWTILYFLVMLFQKERSFVFWSILSGLYGLFFGALCSIPYFIMGGIPSGLAYWISGIPFDITHGISNFIVTLFLYNPLYYLIRNLNKRNTGFDIE